jgi:hypothetical protein
MQTSATSKSGALGRRLFIAGCITIILFSATHIIPMLADLFGEPTKPVEIEAKRAMSAVAVDIGPFHSNWAKLNQLLSVSYSTLLFLVAALNLVALPAVVSYGRLRAMAAVNAIFMGISAAIALIFQFPPPGVFSAIALVLFIGAMVKAAPRTAQ